MDDPKTPDEPKGSVRDAKGKGMALMSRALDGDEEAQGKLIGLVGDPDVGRKIVDVFGNVPTYAEQTPVYSASESRLGGSGQGVSDDRSDSL